MKLTKFINTLNLYLIENPNYEVRIVTSDHRFPTTPSVGIQSISGGVDFDHGKLLIYPDKDIIEK